MAQKSYFWDGNFDGDEIVEEYAPAAPFGQWGLVDGTGKTKIAQSFYIDDTNTDIKRVQLHLERSGAPAGLLTVRIETNNAGVPSGTLAHQYATAFFPENVITAAPGDWYEITFNRAFTLTADTVYWIVISTDRVDTLNYIAWNYGPFIPSSLAYARGVAKHYTAAAWSQAALWDMMFKIMRNDTGSEYDDEFIAEFFDKVLDSFVIEAPLTLTVYPNGAGNVRLDIGSAIVKGVLYENDSALLSVAIPGTGGVNPAIHRVVLRKDNTTQTTRAYVIEGTPGAVPNKPNLGTGDLELAWLYLTAAYNPAVDTPGDEIIFDERPFKYIQEYSSGLPNRSDFKNVVPNSEFYGWSGGANTAPDGWVLNGTPGISSLAVTTIWVSRGRRLRIQSVPIDEGIEGTFPVPQPGVYTFMSYVDVDSGIAKIVISAIDLTGVAAPSVLATKTMYPTNQNVLYCRFSISSTYNAVRIQYLTGTAGSNDDFNIARPTITRSYQPPLFRQYNEVVMLDTALTDASWTASAYSTATNTVSLAATFGNLPPYFKGVIARVACRDSASAAAASDTTAVKIFHKDQTVADDEPLMVVSCAGNANDTWVERVVTIPVDPNDANADIVIRTLASGAGTLDVTIEIVGIIT